MRVKPKTGKLRLVKPKITRRIGKIARLPREIREELNRMVEADASTRAVLNLLAKRGHPEIEAVNLTNWIQGDGKGSSGYADWSREQGLLAAMQARREFAGEVARQRDGFALHEAARLLAVSQLTDTMTRLDLAGINEVFRTNPQVYTGLVTALRRLSRETLEQQRFRQMVLEQMPPPKPASSVPLHLPAGVVKEMREALGKL